MIRKHKSDGSFLGSLFAPYTTIKHSIFINLNFDLGQYQMIGLKADGWNVDLLRHGGKTIYYPLVSCSSLA